MKSPDWHRGFSNFRCAVHSHHSTECAPDWNDLAGHHKQEYPPLLTQGFHRMTVGELRELCVTKFPASKVRGDIMAGFEAIYERAIAVGIEGEVWIDGSFLTNKIDPLDVDLIILTDAHFRDNGTPVQQEFIEWLISNEDDPKKSFLCHTDAVLLFPLGSPWYGLNALSKKHWEENVYVFSVASHEPKGIAVIKIEAGTQLTMTLSSDEVQP
jgi:hypothetical protein